MEQSDGIHFVSGCQNKGAIALFRSSRSQFRRAKLRAEAFNAVNDFGGGAAYAVQRGGQFLQRPALAP